VTDQLPVAGEKETPHGEADSPRAPEVPVQEGQPQKPKTRRKRRTQKPAQEVAHLNPECTNPACIVTCSPQCPNLIDELQWREYVEADKTPLEEGVVTSRRLPA
jgi:hypothetical protein